MTPWIPAVVAGLVSSPLYTLEPEKKWEWCLGRGEPTLSAEKYCSAFFKAWTEEEQEQILHMEWTGATVDKLDRQALMADTWTMLARRLAAEPKEGAGFVEGRDGPPGCLNNLRREILRGGVPEPWRLDRVSVLFNGSAVGTDFAGICLSELLSGLSWLHFAGREMRPALVASLWGKSVRVGADGAMATVVSELCGDDDPSCVSSACPRFEGRGGQGLGAGAIEGSAGIGDLGDSGDFRRAQMFALLHGAACKAAGLSGGEDGFGAWIERRLPRRTEFGTVDLRMGPVGPPGAAGTSISASPVLADELKEVAGDGWGLEYRPLRPGSPVAVSSSRAGTRLHEDKGSSYRALLRTFETPVVFLDAAFDGWAGGSPSVLLSRRLMMIKVSLPVRLPESGRSVVFDNDFLGVVRLASTDADVVGGAGALRVLPASGGSASGSSVLEGAWDFCVEKKGRNGGFNDLSAGVWIMPMAEVFERIGCFGEYEVHRGRGARESWVPLRVAASPGLARAETLGEGLSVAYELLPGSISGGASWIRLEAIVDACRSLQGDVDLPRTDGLLAGDVYLGLLGCKFAEADPASVGGKGEESLSEDGLLAEVLVLTFDQTDDWRGGAGGCEEKAKELSLPATVWYQADELGELSSLDAFRVPEGATRCAGVVALEWTSNGAGGSLWSGGQR